MSNSLGACMKDQSYTRFIFNKESSFVNSLLHLVRSYAVMAFIYVKGKSCHSKVTKNKVSCQAVLDKLSIADK